MSHTHLHTPDASCFSVTANPIISTFLRQGAPEGNETQQRNASNLCHPVCTCKGCRGGQLAWCHKVSWASSYSMLYDSSSPWANVPSVIDSHSKSNQTPESHKCVSTRTSNQTHRAWENSQTNFYGAIWFLHIKVGDPCKLNVLLQSWGLIAEIARDKSDRDLHSRWMHPPLLCITLYVDTSPTLMQHKLLRQNDSGKAEKCGFMNEKYRL